MTEHSFSCPRCGAVSPSIQDAFATMSPLLRMQWKAALGEEKREWLIAFTFGWILILGGLLFLWIARHDPVNEGQVDTVSKVLCGGSILVGLVLFALSVREWKEGKRQAPNRVLLSEGRYCAACSLVWNQDRQVNLQE